MNRKILFFIFTILLIVLIACEDKPNPNHPPILVVSANPTSGVVPLSVNFAATGQDPENQLMVYSWNFGDGKGTSVQQNPVYTYTDTGVFTATCTVTDNGSPPLTATSSISIEVLAQIPVLSSVTPAACVMHIPSFTLTATGSDFQQGAKIVFNGVEMSTSYVSSKKLVCTIKPDDTVIQSLMVNGSGVIPDTSSTVEVKVLNPAPNGGESDSVDFTVHSNYSFENPKTMDTGSGDNPPSILIDQIGRLNLFKCEMQHSQSSDGGNTWSAFDQVTASQITTYGNHDYSVCADVDNNLYVAYTGEPNIQFENKYCDIWLASLTGSDSEWKSENLTGKWDGHGCEIPMITYINGSILIMFGIADWGCYGNYLFKPPFTEWFQSPNMRGGGTELEHTFTIDPYQTLHFAIITMVRGQRTTPNLIHFSSTKDLVSWSPTHMISASDGNASAISLVSDPNGTLYALWLDGAPSKLQRLYFSRSDDAGETWSARKMLSKAGGYYYISAKTDAAGNLNILFSKEDYGAEKVYFLRTIDGGVNWTAPKTVTDRDGRSSWQAFAIDSDGRLHVVWQGGGVYYSRSVAY